MLRRICLAAFAALTTMAAGGATYYVAPDGKPEGNGSRDQPWPTAEYALAKVGGGQTILFRPGIYRGPIEIPKRFAGTEAQPTVLKSEVKWKAVIIGAPVHVISNADGCDWVTIDGFEVMGARYDGVKLNGDHNVVRNCWVHNNKSMGIAMHGQTAGVIEYNLIEFNGGHVQFEHGVYADGDGLTVRGNVVRHNASYGLHLYPSIKNSRVENNLVYGQVRRRGIVVSCPQGGGKNTIVNNTVVESQPLSIANGDGEVVVNNILVAEGPEAITAGENARNVVADYNLCVPESKYQGPHGLGGDPRFVDATKGVFWLRKESPAIGKGSPSHAPALDFWGRLRAKDKSPDLGAMPFEPALTRPAVRADWDNGWAYHRHGTKTGLPDPWALPPAPGPVPR